jgi:hypothetical protein
VPAAAAPGDGGGGAPAAAPVPVSVMSTAELEGSSDAEVRQQAHAALEAAKAAEDIRERWVASPNLPPLLPALCCPSPAQAHAAAAAQLHKGHPRTGSKQRQVACPSPDEPHRLHPPTPSERAAVRCPARTPAGRRAWRRQ